MGARRSFSIHLKIAAEMLKEEQIKEPKPFRTWGGFFCLSQSRILQIKYGLKKATTEQTQQKNPNNNKPQTTRKKNPNQAWKSNSGCAMFSCLIQTDCLKIKFQCFCHSFSLPSLVLPLKPHRCPLLLEQRLALERQLCVVNFPRKWLGRMDPSSRCSA